MADVIIFDAPDKTISYTSGIVNMQVRGNRTGVFQANVPNGNVIILQARIGPLFNWVPIITADADVQQEIVITAQFRVLVTNTTGGEVLAAIHT